VLPISRKINTKAQTEYFPVMKKRN
jgi:hypothetical protein